MPKLSEKLEAFRDDLMVQTTKLMRFGALGGEVGDRLTPLANRLIGLREAARELEAMQEPSPTVTKLGGGGELHEWWDADGKLHREGGPAVEEFRPDGSVEYREWWLHGQLHREGGPAWEKLCPDGSVADRVWCLHGKLHREDGPAFERLRADGSVAYYSWWLHDKQVARPEGE